MDEKIKIWTLLFPAKENPNMERASFDWPILLQHDVKAKCRLISRKFSGMTSFFTRAFAKPIKSHKRLYPFDRPIILLYFRSFVVSVLFARFHFKVIRKSLYRNPSLQELRTRVKPPRFMNDQCKLHHIDSFLGWKVTMMHCILIVREIFENWKKNWLASQKSFPSLVRGVRSAFAGYWQSQSSCFRKTPARPWRYLSSRRSVNRLAIVFILSEDKFENENIPTRGMVPDSWIISLIKHTESSWFFL